MSPALIRQFIHVVPIYSLTSPLDSILKQMDNQLDHKVLIVDHAQTPVGVVAFYDILLGVARVKTVPVADKASSQGALSAVCSVLSNKVAVQQIEAHLPDVAHQSLQAFLDSITHYVGRSPIQPVKCVPDHWSLQEFRIEFIQTTYHPLLSPKTNIGDQEIEWAVVNPQNIGLGLLNQQQVWKTLALFPLQPDHNSYHWSQPSFPCIEQDNQKLQDRQVDLPFFSQSEAQWIEPNPDLDILWSTFLYRLTEAQTCVEKLEGTVSKLQGKAKTNNDLLAYISHELKTPLTAIAGLSELLTQKRSFPPERYQYYAHLIHQSSHQMMLLMTGLFDLIQIETTPTVLSPQPIALPSLCANVYAQIKERQIGLTIHHPNSINTPLQEPKSTISNTSNPPFPLKITIQPGLESVLADESCFKKLLANLVTNALVLSDLNQDITLTITVATQNTSQLWLKVSVTHVGTSMTELQQTQIFQQLALFKNKTHPPLKGVGLRFLLALRLSEQQGGTLTFIIDHLPFQDNTLPSALNHDHRKMEVTAFLPVTLPNHTLNTTEQSSVSEKYAHTVMSRLATRPTLPPSKAFIVVVDNVPRHLSQLSDVLSELGYSVAIARFYSDALAKIQCLDPAAVIFNPALSHQSDINLLKQLKQDHQTPSIPVIATTTILQSAQDHHYIDAYLQFPISALSMQQLLLTVTKAPTSSSSPSFSLSPITVLYFDGLLWLQVQDANEDENLLEASEMDLNSILHPYHCRVIEVDSPDQAELLAKVWHPDVMVFGHGETQLTQQQYVHLESCFRTFQQCAELEKLPIVTLSTVSTELAHYLGLRVFPCLEPLVSIPSDDIQALPSLALVQVIRVAAAAYPQLRPGNKPS